MSAPAIVCVTDTTIRDNGIFGLRLLSGTSTTITRAMISGNADTGIWVDAEAAGTTTTADIAYSTAEGSNYGITVYSGNATAVVRASIHNSRLLGNGAAAMNSQSNSGASVTVSASDNIVSNNTNGLGAVFTDAKVWASGNTVSNNGTGLRTISGGIFESAGNNAVRNSTTAGTSGTITMIATK